MVDLLVYTNHRMGDMYYNMTTKIVKYLVASGPRKFPSPKVKLSFLCDL